MIYAHKFLYKVNMWKLTLETLSALKEFQDKIGKEFDVVLHYGVEGLHSESGYHPKGLAVDLHIELEGEILGIRTQCEMAVLYWRGGVGVYPFWNHRGLHLDLGSANRRWWRDVAGNYCELDSIKWEDF